LTRRNSVAKIPKYELLAKQTDALLHRPARLESRIDETSGDDAGRKGTRFCRSGIENWAIGGAERKGENEYRISNGRKKMIIDFPTGLVPVACWFGN
jgi:hypothetical protein